MERLRDEPPYERLEQLGAKLAAGLDEAATAAGIPHTVTRVGSMMTLFFNPDPVTDWEVAAKCNTERFGKYFWKLIDRGVYMPCSQYEALFVCHSSWLTLELMPEELSESVDACLAKGLK